MAENDLFKPVTNESEMNQLFPPFNAGNFSCNSEVFLKKMAHTALNLSWCFLIDTEERSHYSLR